MKLNDIKLLAIEEALKSDCHYQHSSLIIYKGRVLVSEHNDFQFHSEHKALLSVQRLLCSQYGRKEL